MIECPQPGTKADAEELCWLLSRLFLPNDIQPPTGWWEMPNGDASPACYAWRGGTFQTFIEAIWNNESDDEVKIQVVVEYTKFKLTGKPTSVDSLSVDYSRPCTN